MSLAKESLLENLMEYSLEEALESYQETEEFAKLEKKRDQAYKELEEKFDDDTYSFIMKRVDICNIRLEREGYFLYRQAFKDCVSLLKQLEIIR